jgi:hypothetical protein
LQRVEQARLSCKEVVQIFFFGQCQFLLMFGAVPKAFPLAGENSRIGHIGFQYPPSYKAVRDTSNRGSIIALQAEGQIYLGWINGSSWNSLTI